MPRNQENGPPKTLHATSDGRIQQGIDESLGNYAKMLAWLIRSGRVDLAPGTESHLWFSHDDDCAVLRGSSPCECRPNARTLIGQKWTFGEYESRVARGE